MTQSPYGGTASPSSPPATEATKGASSSEFGATTISGAPKPAGTAGSSAVDAAADARTTVTSAVSAPQQRPVTPPAPARGARGRGPRRARLQLRNISPLTVLKFSCVLAIALFFVWLIMVGILYGVLDAAGVLDHVNDAYNTLSGPGSKPLITAGVVFGGAAIIGVVNIILFVALTTIGSVIYNLCADLVGGIEITLSER